MSSEYTGKAVLVTGASKGIGKAIAQHFLEQGANVAFGVRDRNSHAISDETLQNKRALIVQMDVADENQIMSAVDVSIKKFGTIDILVNNAGVDQPCRLTDVTQEHLDYVWDTNVKGLILTTKYVAKHMIDKKAGKIINLSSIAGKEGNACHVAYVSSKHAVIGATTSMANELVEHGINVNAVCPGLIDTDMLRNFFKDLSKITGVDADKELQVLIDKTPRGKMGSPKDVAELVGFLCSNKASNINGQAINTDGGMLQH